VDYSSSYILSSDGSDCDDYGSGVAYEELTQPGTATVVTGGKEGTKSTSKSQDSSSDPTSWGLLRRRGIVVVVVYIYYY